MPIRVLLVDHHDIVREGLRLIIESQPDLLVVGEARDDESCLQVLEETQPDVVIMDCGRDVENHRARARAKLGVKGRVGLLRWAVSQGLVEP